VLDTLFRPEYAHRQEAGKAAKLAAHCLSGKSTIMSKKTYGDHDEDISTHRNHLERMVAFYAKTASNYNTWHCDPQNNSSHNYAVRETLTLMNRVRARTLLDVCCGTGRAAKAALDAGFDARGIDISRELLDIGTRELGIPAGRLDHGDATCLPYADQSFDMACIMGALHHTARPRAIVAEMLRVARLGVVISDELNHLPNGIKSLLVRLGVFEPVYRIIFRRPLRNFRRQGNSADDGPAFWFSLEEIIPMVQMHFPRFKCLTFYRAGRFQVCSYHFPRLFARQGVVSGWNENAQPTRSCVNNP
jgi:ubiquinone/menaquinone biosynthesis C-methylase UbiE